MPSCNQQQQIEVSITILKQMFAYLRALKVDLRSFLTFKGYLLDDLLQPDAYIPFEVYLDIQDSAAEYVHDPYFGLHMGQYAEAGSWSILGYLMMNCDSLGEAFEKSSRYHRIIGNMIHGEIKPYQNTIKIKLLTPESVPLMSRHCFESAISSTCRMMRTLTGKEIDPLAVTFTYPEPDSVEDYQRIFRCPITFGHEENAFIIPLSFVEIPIRYANPDMVDYFEEYAQEILSVIENKYTYTREVTRILLENLDRESLTINQVASELALSVRTLQNRLKEEGAVFSDLLTGIRQRLAKKYLRENYTVEEITYLLGYSDPSVFRKAFKKWAGITPGEYRGFPVSRLL
jgi:AraC-like DNA-binding protein